jgi:transcriptional regulator with XRE-family HTH domain
MIKKIPVTPAKPRSPNTVDQHIGSRIRQRRNELHLSQEKLAEAMGISFQQVQKYEKGTNRVAGSRMVQIAVLLKADIDFFYPAKANGQRPVASIMDGFLASKDGVVIAEAFVRIKDPQVRHIIASSIARLAGALDCA